MKGRCVGGIMRMRQEMGREAQKWTEEKRARAGIDRARDREGAKGERRGVRGM